MDTKLDLYLAVVFVPAILIVFLPVALLVRTFDEILSLFAPAPNALVSVPDVRSRAYSQIVRINRKVK